ncbi:MAG: VWA domain-containing protein [Planctomycetota bacterium]|jgi:hypothetical protein
MMLAGLVKHLNGFYLLVEEGIHVDKTYAFQNGPEPWVFFLVILPAVVLFSVYFYRLESERLSPKVRFLLAGLRCLVILVVVFCLFRPVLLTQRVREVKPVSVVLLDNSASMREHDLYTQETVRARLAQESGLGSAELLREETRQHLVERVLENPQSDWLGKLEARYDLKYYGFDATLTPLGGLYDLNAEGNSTRLGDALSEVVKEYRGQRLSNVILISDGRSNRGREPADGAALAMAEQIPVHTVGVGDPSVARNIEIVGVTAPDVVLVNDEVIFKVSIASRGYESRAVTLILKNRNDGSILATKDAELKGDDIEQQEVLYWKPDLEGEYPLQIEIPVDSEEQDADDNKHALLLRVESARIKVLYVDGYPRWEYRYLKNLLIRVENFEVQVLLQSADPAFIQESSKGVSPLKEFPRQLKDLMDYHVILFGDVDPDELGDGMEESGRILEHIKEFVEAGGGFLMQAGSEYSPVAYIDTPVADILPVIPGNYAEQLMIAGEMGDSSFRMKLENPLEAPEVMRLDKDALKNRRLWEDPEYGLTGFHWYFPLERAKPGAEIWARHPVNKNRYGNHVIFATTYYPAGRTIFLGVDSTWLWRFPYGDRYQDLFWRKTVRYLAQNKLRRKDYRFDLSTDRSRYDINERIHITARIRDVDFQLSDQPSWKIKTLDPSGKMDELELNLVEEGNYERIAVAEDPGTYQLRGRDRSGRSPPCPDLLRGHDPAA